PRGNDRCRDVASVSCLERWWSSRSERLSHRSSLRQRSSCANRQCSTPTLLCSQSSQGLLTGCCGGSASLPWWSSCGEAREAAHYRPRRHFIAMNVSEAKDRPDRRKPA